MNILAKSLELQFTTQLGKTSTISIDSPIEPVDVTKVNEAMDQILQANIFLTSSGDYISKKSATLVERNVKGYEVK